MNEPKWYYFNANNETIGPFSKAVLVELSQAGQISNETLVFKEGTEAWQPFGAAFTQPPEPEHLPPEPEPEPLPPENGCLIKTAVIFVVLVVIVITNAPTSEEIKKRDAQREEDRLNELAKRDRENEELRKEQNREMMRRYIRAFPNGR
jgi:GYF domain 2